MSVPAQTQTGPSFQRQGAIILSVFALIWAMAGASGVDDGGVFWAIGAVALIATVGAIVHAVRTESTRTSPRQLAPDWQRRYNLVGIAQGAAILVTIFVLVSLDVPGLIPPVVCLIVGIHFFPLDSTFDQQEYRWTGIALCAVGAVGIALFGPASDEAVRALVGIGAALVLWSTAFIVVRQG